MPDVRVNDLVWVALRWLRGDGTPVLARVDDDAGIIRWDSGGYCPLSDDYEILKRYDWPEDEPDDAAFYREFGPQPQPLSQGAGWLAPDGRFWPCRAYEHGEHERALSYMIYGEYGTWNSIENRGWVKIYSSGLCCRPFRWIDRARHEMDLTPGQGAALQSIVLLNPESKFGMEMGAQLTYLLKEVADA